jgi:cytidine deaminase
MPVDAELIELAKKARANAYCPYSGYSVGSAVRCAEGKVYTGCNVENASLGLTICAERAALVAMVSDGCQRVETIAVATKNGVAPCGACRQFIAEFCDDPASVRVLVSSDGGSVSEYLLADLIPHTFNKASLD